MTTKQHAAITIDATNFEREVLQSAQPVLVDFWAEWCQPCRAIGPVIEELAAEFEGMAKVGKVDVDENGPLAERYDIRSIPTLLCFKNGQVVDRVQGVVPKSELADMLTTHSAKTWAN